MKNKKVPSLLKDKNNFEKVIGEKVLKNGENQYLIKIRGKPYKDSVWISKNLFFDLKLSDTVLPKDIFPNFDEAHVYDPDFDIIQSILNFSEGKYLVKWKKLPLEEATYHANIPASEFATYDRRKKAKFTSIKSFPHRKKKLLLIDESINQEDPFILSKKNSLDYIINCYNNGKNAILETTEATFDYDIFQIFCMNLYSGYNDTGPFLVYTTPENAEKWYDVLNNNKQLTTLAYYGSDNSLRIADAVCFFLNDSHQKLKFHFIIVTPSTYKKRQAQLSKLKFSASIATNSLALPKDLESTFSILIKEKNIIQENELTSELCKLLLEYDNDNDENNAQSEIDFIQNLQSQAQFLFFHQKQNKLPSIEEAVDCSAFFTKFEKHAILRYIKELGIHSSLKQKRSTNNISFDDVSDKLYEILQHPFLLENEEQYEMYHNLHLKDVSAKFKVCFDLIQQSTETICIITCFHQLQILLNDFLDEEGISPNKAFVLDIYNPDEKGCKNFILFGDADYEFPKNTKSIKRLIFKVCYEDKTQDYSNELLCKIICMAAMQLPFIKYEDNHSKNKSEDDEKPKRPTKKENRKKGKKNSTKLKEDKNKTKEESNFFRDNENKSEPSEVGSEIFRFSSFIFDQIDNDKDFWNNLDMIEIDNEKRVYSKELNERELLITERCIYHFGWGNWELMKRHLIFDISTTDLIKLVSTILFESFRSYALDKDFTFFFHYIEQYENYKNILFPKGNKFKEMKEKLTNDMKRFQNQMILKNFNLLDFLPKIDFSKIPKINVKWWNDSFEGSIIKCISLYGYDNYINASNNEKEDKQIIRITKNERFFEMFNERYLFVLEESVNILKKSKEIVYSLLNEHNKDKWQVVEEVIKICDYVISNGIKIKQDNKRKKKDIKKLIKNIIRNAKFFTIENKYFFSNVQDNSEQRTFLKDLIESYDFYYNIRFLLKSNVIQKVINKNPWNLLDTKIEKKYYKFIYSNGLLALQDIKAMIPKFNLPPTAFPKELQDPNIITERVSFLTNKLTEYKDGMKHRTRINIPRERAEIDIDKDIDDSVEEETITTTTYDDSQDITTTSDWISNDSPESFLIELPPSPPPKVPISPTITKSLTPKPENTKQNEDKKDDNDSPANINKHDKHPESQNTDDFADDEYSEDDGFSIPLNDNYFEEMGSESSSELAGDEIDMQMNDNSNILSSDYEEDDQDIISESMDNMSSDSTYKEFIEQRPPLDIYTSQKVPLLESITLPIYLSQTTTLYNLGSIICTSDLFHTERYLFPSNYTITRVWKSVKHKGKDCVWTCKIVPNDDLSAPMFTVFEKDEGYFKGNTPSAPWRMIIQEISKRYPDTFQNLSVSGVEMFELSNKYVIGLLEQLPNAEKCANYQMKTYPVNHENSIQTIAIPPKISKRKKKRRHHHKFNN